MREEMLVVWLGCGELFGKFFDELCWKLLWGIAFTAVWDWSFFVDWKRVWDLRVCAQQYARGHSNIAFKETWNYGVKG